MYSICPDITTRLGTCLFVAIIAIYTKLTKNNIFGDKIACRKKRRLKLPGNVYKDCSKQ